MLGEREVFVEREERDAIEADDEHLHQTPERLVRALSVGRVVDGERAAQSVEGQHEHCGGLERARAQVRELLRRRAGAAREDGADGTHETVDGAACASTNSVAV